MLYPLSYEGGMTSVPGSDLLAPETGTPWRAG